MSERCGDLRGLEGVVGGSGNGCIDRIVSIEDTNRTSDLRVSSKIQFEKV